MGTEHQRKAGEDFMKKIVLALAFVLWESFMISGSDEAVTLIEATGTLTQLHFLMVEIILALNVRISLETLN